MYYKIALFATLALIAFSGCGEQDIDDKNPGFENQLFEAKQGTVTYVKTVWADERPIINEIVLIFDDYGLKFREEVEGGSSLIVDGQTKKAYSLLATTKTYVEHASYDAYASLISQFIYLGDDGQSVWSVFPEYSKEPSKIIAGKQCSAVSWLVDGKTIERAGWKRIIFWDQYYEGQPETDGSVRLEAKSFTESIPENSFSIPGGFLKGN